MLLGSKLDDLQGGTVSEGPTCPRARAREHDASSGYHQVIIKHESKGSEFEILQYHYTIQDLSIKLAPSYHQVIIK